MNLNQLNIVNNFFSLFLTADSVSLSCSSGLKEFKISTSQLASPLKACAHFIVFTFVLFKKNLLFCITI